MAKKSNNNNENNRVIKTAWRQRMRRQQRNNQLSKAWRRENGGEKALMANIVAASIEIGVSRQWRARTSISSMAMP